MARAVPHQRLHDLLAAALVNDLEPIGQLAGFPGCQAAERFSAHEVLHRHRLAGAQQRAVEHGVRHRIALARVVGGQVEPPRLDALLPAREGEGGVDDRACPRRIGLARAHEVPAIGQALGRLRLERLRHAGQALCVGAPGPQRLAAAVADRHVGAVHGPGAVERGDPHRAVLAADLHVHAEVGDERAGAHVHRRGGVEQRLAEPCRFDLDHMEAGRGQRDAHHLERPRIAALQLRQLEPLRRRIGLEQRQRARGHPALDLLALRAAAPVHVRHGLGPLVARQAGVLGGDLALVIAAQPDVPGQDVGIGLQPAHAHRTGAGRSAQIALHMAQRDRQQRRRRTRAGRFGVALDDAEWRGSELGDRRCVAGGDLHRKRAGVGQRPTGAVFQAGRQRQREDGVVGHALGQHDRLDLGGAVVVVGLRRDRRAAGRHQPHLCGELAIDRRRKAQHQRADRQARRTGALTLARELGAELGAHLVRKALLGTRDDVRVGRRRNATPPHHPHGRVGRQRARAAQHQQPRLALGFELRVFQRACSGGLEDLIAHGATHEAHRQALADAVDLAPGVVGHAALGGRAVEREDEVLVFLEGRAVVGLRVEHRRPAGAELERRGAAERGRHASGQRLPVGAQLHAAAHTGRQRLFEVVDPVAIAGPAAAARGERRRCAHADERHRIGQSRLAERHHGLGKGERHLLDVRHLALRAQAADGSGVCRACQQRQQRPGCTPNCEFHQAPTASLRRV